MLARINRESQHAYPENRQRPQKEPHDVCRRVPDDPRHNTSLSMRGYNTSESVRVNDFVVREDAVARDEQSVRALERALAQRENALRSLINWRRNAAGDGEPELDKSAS